MPYYCSTLFQKILDEVFFIMPIYGSKSVKNKGSIISVVGKTTVEIIELFECTQKVP